MEKRKWKVRERSLAGRSARRILLAGLVLASCFLRIGGGEEVGSLPAAERLDDEERAILLAREKGNDLDRVEADIDFDPATRRIHEAVRLIYREAASVKMFDLCEELEISDLRSLDSSLRLFRRADEVYILGKSVRVIEMSIDGVVRSGHGGLADMLNGGAVRQGGKNARITTLCSRLVPFLPCRTGRFVEARTAVRLPPGFRCLASGTHRRDGGGTSGKWFVFECDGSHGVAITCGDFRPAGRVAASVPVNLFVAAGLDLDLRPYRARIRGIVDFFSGRFGPPGVPELNLLFQTDRFYGGCSFKGYALINVASCGSGAPEAGEMPPLFLSNSRWDCLAHEIAHQWWGGVVAAKRMDDAWISEGLAQYSTLLFLHDRLSGKAFNVVLERMYEGVATKAAAGKLTDAVKLAYIQPDLVAFQVLVYNKGALIFWMLQELLGEERMLERLRQLLAQWRFQCLESGALIRFLAGQDPLLQSFLAGWVGRAEVPEVEYRVFSQGGMARLEVDQRNGPFVFPLRVRCRMRSGEKLLTFPVLRARESFILASDEAGLRSVEFVLPGAPGLESPPEAGKGFLSRRLAGPPDHSGR